MRRRAPVIAVVLVAVAVVVSACSPGSSTPGADVNGAGFDGPAAAPGRSDAKLRITTLSGPAPFVTGGDAVVAVDSPAGRSLEDVTIRRGDTDITDRFGVDDDPHRPAGALPRLIATVEGLPGGETRLTAGNGDDSAALTILNHPVAGPLFSGPHLSPLVCTTEQAGLGAPLDDCGAPSQVRWRYLTTGGELVDLADPAAVPGEVATTTTSEGATVAFVIRIETSVQNRSITTIAILDPRPGGEADPSPGPPADPDPVPRWDRSGWNGRLVMQFGGGCGTSYAQGGATPSVEQLDLLGQGYAVANGSLTTLETNCNAVVSAESAMVAKEHFTETYGVPRHTIATGASGGAIQQLQIVQNYPGILDALAPSAPFPDAASLASTIADCGLLERWFGRDGGSAGVIPAGQMSGAGLTDDQQRAIAGFATSLTCRFWSQSFLQILDASQGCSPELVTQVYDLAVRPRGVRCTYQDVNVNLLGVDPQTGFAARPLDNVGIQYGLQALRDGAISVDDFLALNENIGGYDIDGGWQPERERAPDDVLERAYRSGLVTAGTATAEAGGLDRDGSGGLGEVPIIVTNAYTDELGDIHDRERAFVLGDRLRLPDGRPDPSLALWTVPTSGDLGAVAEQLTSGAGQRGHPAVPVLDRWLSAAEDMAADDRPWVERLASARPDEAADRCVLGSGEELTGPGIYEPGTPCATEYPVVSNPRRVAGAPRVDDILGCRLANPDPSAYGAALGDAQADRLRRIFPDGVCDWTAPGRGQTEPAGVWQIHGQP